MSYNYSSEPLLDMFLFETTQLLEQLEACILNTEKNATYTEDDINEIFRIMHTIKGSSAMMKYNNISKLAHAMEDLFDYIRDGNRENIDYPELSDLVLDNVDFIKEQVKKIESGDKAGDDASELISKNEEALTKIKGTGKAVKACNTYKATIYFLEDSEMENIRAFSVINNLEEIAEEIHHTPEDLMDEKASQIIKDEGFKFHFKSDYSYVDVHQLLMQTIFLKELELEEYKEENNPRKENIQKLNTHHQSIISVPVIRLDRLMDLMGEFVIAEAMVTQNPDLQGLELSNFKKASLQLNKITSELQDVVMSIRMVPLSATFNKMNRIVRDMSKDLDKEIKLTLKGEETEVDKNIIEHMSDPLMHLVRNAIDHGLESKEDREKLGKPIVGSITLEAKNVGSDVLITVKDDGKGLKKENIIKKAKDKGLIRKPIEEMSDNEINNLILLPGFSTNKDVTEYSGRGVGMDVVTRGIESVGGTVSIDSEEAVGTSLTMKIPLTLAIVDGINIRVGKSNYTIPTISISEFFKPVLSDIIIDPDNNEMVMVRGDCLPILRLHKIFNLETQVKDFEDGIFIIIQQDKNAICLFVDELIGQQQIVVKALPEYVSKGKKVKGLTGCTLLGDGTISLILDVSGLASYLE